MTDVTKLAVEAALIEELTAALDATVLWRDMDGDYTFSKDLASEYTNKLSASILPIIRRIHNEAVEAERARIVATIRDLPACVQGSQTAWIADAIERGQTGGD